MHVMPAFHMIATIATIVAVAAIAEKRETTYRCKNQNSAIDTICISAEIKVIWESFIAAIATIEIASAIAVATIAAVADQGVSI